MSRRGLVLGAGVAGLAAVGVGASQLIGPGAEVVPGRSRAKPIPTDPRPPQAADVVIIGGGNIGAAAALFLAQAGLDVVLCEKGAVGGEASGRSVGHTFTLGLEPEKLEMAALSKQLWPTMNALAGAETGYRQDGLLMQIKDEQDRQFWEGWLKGARSLSPQARILDSRSTAQMVKTRAPWPGAVYDPTDGRAEPTLVAPAFAAGARAHGAKIVAPCAVRGVESSAGELSAVITEFGAIRTKRAILAGGAWSTPFVENMGLRLPIGNLFSWCTSFYGVPGPITNGIFGDTTWRRQIDGGFTTSLMTASAPITPDSFRYLREMIGAMQVANADWTIHPRLGVYFFNELMQPSRWRMDQVSPFEKRRILEPKIDEHVVRRALDEMRRSIPEFANLRPGAPWGGVLSSTPDTNPVLGPLPGVKGLVIATGFSDGLTLAPGAGRLVADLVLGKSSALDLRPFRFERLQ